MNSTVEKRSYFSYSILNAVTYGIYGVVERSKITADIDTICASDGQQNRHSFGQAWIYSKLYNLMIASIFGIPLAIGGSVGISYFLPFGGFLGFLAVLGVIILVSFSLEGLYLPSWWYSQHNRLVLNSHRYKMVLNDTAFDTAIWKTLMFFPMNVFSLLGYVTCVAGVASFVVLVRDTYYKSLGFAVLSLFGGYFLGAIMLFIKNIINLPFYYTLKTINRFAENMSVTYAEPFDPMGLLDEDNKNNIFMRTINVLNNFGREKTVAPVEEVEQTTILNTEKGKGVLSSNDIIIAHEPTGGTIECTAGTNKGYIYNVAFGEELVIGKDPKIANIVISPEFKDVSRKHCGISFNDSNGMYSVTDYSSNGTRINGTRMEPGKPVKVRKGSQIALGKGDNIFVVK